MGGRGVQKIESLFRMQILWILFLGIITELDFFLVHFYAFTGLFLSSRYRTGIIFVCCLFLFFIFGVGVSRSVNSLLCDLQSFN